MVSAAEVEIELLSQEDIDGLNIKELQKALVLRGMDNKGLKPALRERLSARERNERQKVAVQAALEAQVAAAQQQQVLGGGEE